MPRPRDRRRGQRFEATEALPPFDIQPPFSPRAIVYERHLLPLVSPKFLILLKLPIYHERCN
jgi:hypothetical protein